MLAFLGGRVLNRKSCCDRDLDLLRRCAMAHSLRPDLREQLSLHIDDARRRRTRLVIIPDVVDPCADRIRAHQSGIVGLQEVLGRGCVLHPRIKPEIVALPFENHRHPVVNRRSHRVRSCCKRPGAEGAILRQDTKEQSTSPEALDGRGRSDDRCETEAQ